MANSSIFKIMAVAIRAAGSKNHQAGTLHGGIYFPAHNIGGKTVSARWEGNCFINHPSYTDSQGVVHEPSNDMIRVTAWNGKNSAAGKGLADMFAKIVGVGKEFSAELRLKQFPKRLLINGVPMANPADGQPITYPGYTFTIVGDLLWGDDSANLIANEVAQWANCPQASFYSRPQFWSVPGHADNTLWKDIIAKRMAHQYDGSATYGYARVMLPEGATLATTTPTPAPIQTPATPLTTAAPLTAAAPVMDAATMQAFIQQMMAQGLMPGGVVAPPANTAMPLTGYTAPPLTGSLPIMPSDGSLTPPPMTAGAGNMLSPL